MNSQTIIFKVQKDSSKFIPVAQIKSIRNFPDIGHLELRVLQTFTAMVTIYQLPYSPV